MTFVDSLKLPLTHPKADAISILSHYRYGAYATETSCEIAFFCAEKWVTEIIPDFAEYADSQAGNTRIYGWVPYAALRSFLTKYCPVFIPDMIPEITA